MNKFVAGCEVALGQVRSCGTPAIGRCAICGRAICHMHRAYDLNTAYVTMCVSCALETQKGIRLFYCYAHEDKTLRDDLEMHLSSLKHLKQVTHWYDGEICAGVDWQQEIEVQLNASHIILLLISPHFMASDYCYATEMKQALKRHTAGKARVIPIILRPVIWEDAPFSKLQILPRNGIPITRWQDRDEALWDVAKEIRKVVKDMLLSLKTDEERLQEEQLQAGKALEESKLYHHTLLAYEHVIDAGSKDPIVFALKAHALNNLERYEEALEACEEAIRLDPQSVIAHANKGYALNRLERYEEGLEACEKTIQFDPNYSAAHNNKGYACMGLKRYNEALKAYEQAISLKPAAATTYHNIGDVLISLKRYDEAEQAYKKAHELGYGDE